MQGLSFTLKGRVGKNGETSSSALEFESTQPKKICPFLQTSYRAPPPTHTNAHMTNEGTRWKADRQVGHPIICPGPGQLLFTAPRLPQRKYLYIFIVKALLFIAIGMLRAFHGI